MAWVDATYSNGRIVVDFGSLNVEDASITKTYVCDMFIGDTLQDSKEVNVAGDETQAQVIFTGNFFPDTTYRFNWYRKNDLGITYQLTRPQSDAAAITIPSSGGGGSGEDGDFSWKNIYLEGVLIENDTGIRILLEGQQPEEEPLALDQSFIFIASTVQEEQPDFPPTLTAQFNAEDYGWIYWNFHNVPPGTYYINARHVESGTYKDPSWSTFIIVPQTAPDRFYFSNVARGSEIKYFTAQEWNDFRKSINEWREYKGLSPANITLAAPGNLITASLVNSAIRAIEDIPGHGTLPNDAIPDVTVITAQFFFDLENALNAVPE